MQTRFMRLSCVAAPGVFFGSVVGRLQPRYYSISSSPKAHPTAIHVTCSVVAERKGTGRLHNGVASSWLGSLPIGESRNFVRWNS